MIEPLQSTYDYVYPKNPLTQRRQFHLLPESVELWLGESVYESEIEKEGGVWQHPKCQRLFEKIMQKMVPHTKHEHFPWQITLVNCNKLNSWALPGGRMAVYRRLVESVVLEKRDFGLGPISLEDKLASFVGHEMVHPSANHSANQIAFTVYLFLFKVVLNDIINYSVLGLFTDLCQFSRSRADEFEADHCGMQIMAQAGYDPKAAIWLQHFFMVHSNHEKPWFGWLSGWFNSHPTNQERLKANEATLAELKLSKAI